MNFPKEPNFSRGGDNFARGEGRAPLLTTPLSHLYNKHKYQVAENALLCIPRFLPKTRCNEAKTKYLCFFVDPFWEHGWMNLTAASAAIVLTSNLVFRLHVLLMWQLI